MSEQAKSFDEIVEEIVAGDPRYRREAYTFIQLALDYFRERDEKHEGRHHISGPELLSGVRGLALEQYGPLARDVLNHWGLFRGSDVGEIVYNLIDHRLMIRSEEDSKEDFDGVMDFDESMDREYPW